MMRSESLLIAVSFQFKTWDIDLRLSRFLDTTSLNYFIYTFFSKFHDVCTLRWRCVEMNWIVANQAIMSQKITEAQRISKWSLSCDNQN